jgi:hypothetical protein
MFRSLKKFCALLKKLTQKQATVPEQVSKTAPATVQEPAPTPVPATVPATGTATVPATGTATVPAIGTAPVQAPDQATVQEPAPTSVSTTDQATVQEPAPTSVSTTDQETKSNFVKCATELHETTDGRKKILKRINQLMTTLEGDVSLSEEGDELLKSLQSSYTLMTEKIWQLKDQTEATLYLLQKQWIDDKLQTAINDGMVAHTRHGGVQERFLNAKGTNTVAIEAKGKATEELTRAELQLARKKLKLSDELIFVKKLCSTANINLENCVDITKFCYKTNEEVDTSSRVLSEHIDSLSTASTQVSEAQTEFDHYDNLCLKSADELSQAAQNLADASETLQTAIASVASCTELKEQLDEFHANRLEQKKEEFEDIISSHVGLDDASKMNDFLQALCSGTDTDTDTDTDISKLFKQAFGPRSVENLSRSLINFHSTAANLLGFTEKVGVRIAALSADGQYVRVFDQNGKTVISCSMVDFSKVLEKLQLKPVITDTDSGIDSGDDDEAAVAVVLIGNNVGKMIENGNQPTATKVSPGEETLRDV